jgi:nucleoid DNA-binding protein
MAGAAHSSCKLAVLAASRTDAPVDAAALPALFSRSRRSAMNMTEPTTTKKNPLSKAEILSAVAGVVGEEASKHVKAVFEALVSVGHEELKKSGVFVLPGFAKFVVVNKAARPAHEGINPFTKEKQLFAAKPESRTVKASPVKVVKDAVA